MRERGIVPRRIKGFRDIDAATNAVRWRILDTAAAVYERYGFERWDTPALEYADCLGKHLPDDDTTEEGIYSFRNPEEEPILADDGKELRDSQNNVLMEHHHVALRYDLTAPLARRYAEMLWDRTRQGYFKGGGKPPLVRRYQLGPVYRFEAKLDPGRYREFWQLDFDTVGVADPSCDAEVGCILCDALEALGLGRGDYEVRVNNRKLHRGLFERLGVAGNETLERDILRVVDKVDKLGVDGVAGELGEGRKDPESGAFIPGLKLGTDHIDAIVGFLDSCVGLNGRAAVLERLDAELGGTPSGREGLDELIAMHEVFAALGYGDDRVVFDPSVARGLAYYTGPVFEAVSNLEYRDAKGQVRRFGSICGGGRYDGLVERMLGVPVPATGASIGVDRLGELLSQLEGADTVTGPVFVTVMDADRRLDYQKLAAELRAAGIPTEVYYGMQRRVPKQLAYADARGCPVAIIAGGNEFANGTVSIKNLRLGKALSSQITDRDEWRNAQPAQVEVPREDLVATVREMLTAPVPTVGDED